MTGKDAPGNNKSNAVENQDQAGQIIDKIHEYRVPVSQVTTPTTSTAPTYSMAGQPGLSQQVPKGTSQPPVSQAQPPSSAPVLPQSVNSAQQTNYYHLGYGSAPFTCWPSKLTTNHSTDGLYGIVPYNSMYCSSARKESLDESPVRPRNEKILQRLNQMYSELCNLRGMLARELMTRRPPSVPSPQLPYEKGRPSGPSRADIERFNELLDMVYQSMQQKTLFLQPQSQDANPSPLSSSSSPDQLLADLSCASELYSQVHQLGVDIYCQLLSSIASLDLNQIPPNHPTQE